jgi:hypothetical protein
MKIWIASILLTLALTLAGCGANQSYLEKVDTFDRQRWDSMMIHEPSAESTNWGIWTSMQGGG